MDDISFFQKEEKRSELRGAVQLLRQYSDAISRGDLNEHEIAALYQKLEDIEQLCLSIGELGRELLLHEKNKLGGIQVNEFLDASGTVERGANWASNCKDAIELITMAQSCRVLGCFVKSAIPGDKTLIRERISNANHEVKSALQLLDDSKSKYRQLLVEPLNKAKRDWLLNPFGWDLAGRKKFPACALNRFSEAQMKAKEFGGGFHQHSDQVLSVVDQQECVAENGFYIDVQQSDAGRVEVVNLSGV